MRRFSEGQKALGRRVQTVRRLSAYEVEFRAASEAVKQRSGGRCEGRVLGVCAGAAVHVHHRKLRARGGTNDLSNLLHLCGPCHSFAHLNPAEGTALGLLVPSWEKDRDHA